VLGTDAEDSRQLVYTGYFKYSLCSPSREFLPGSLQSYREDEEGVVKEEWHLTSVTPLSVQFDFPTVTSPHGQ